MKRVADDSTFLGTAPIGRILWRIAPPVMLAQLIQGLYNIVDSFFVGRYSGDGLTALSVIFPIQLIIIALAVGTGVGVNTYMARCYAEGEPDRARKCAGTGIVLAVLTWIVFALLAAAVMRPYAMTGARSPAAVEDAVTYGTIVSVGSIGCFLESMFSKIHQSRGNMRLPMIAQVVGAVINMVLDPLLIFGLWGLPALGVAGAAYATVLGLYYKMQSFFFIPINGLQTCIVPVLSYNFTQKAYKRCEKTMNFSFLICLVFMLIGFVSFVFFPGAVISLFSRDPAVHEIGNIAFRIIGCSFFSACFSLMLPVFFQAIGRGIPSLMLSLCRQIFCLLTLFYLFSLIGLNFTWIAFPAAETITGAVGLILYIRTLRRWRQELDKQGEPEV